MVAGERWEPELPLLSQPGPRLTILVASATRPPAHHTFTLPSSLTLTLLLAEPVGATRPSHTHATFLPLLSGPVPYAHAPVTHVLSFLLPSGLVPHAHTSHARAAFLVLCIVTHPLVTHIGLCTVRVLHAEKHAGGPAPWYLSLHVRLPNARPIFQPLPHPCGLLQANWVPLVLHRPE